MHRAERDAEPDARKPNRGPAAGPRNRAALIAAAREVYANDGLGVPFSAVAKRAGVGQGPQTAPLPPHQHDGLRQSGAPTCAGIRPMPSNA